VADRDRLAVELLDGLGVPADDVLDPVAGDALRVRARLVDRVGFARPAGSDRRVAGIAERIDPVAPRVRVEPEAVDENDRCACGSGDRVSLSDASL
jgi:hypothetical protein